MYQQWSVDQIQDPTYRAKFIDVPDVIADWLAPYGGFEGRDVLDFGCGEATMALGVALRHKARRVVAIDIHSEVKNAMPFAQTQLGLQQLPRNLEVLLVEPDLPLERLGSFDVIYSWSVFEHVRQDLIEHCLTMMKHALRPGGVMFLQTTPLFYSAFGSHLQPWIPAPWAHLSMQHDLFVGALLKANSDRKQTSSLLRTYETLNRATEAQIIRAAKRVGFEIVRKHLTYDDYPIPDELQAIYREDVLRTNQLVFMAIHGTA